MLGPNLPAIGNFITVSTAVVSPVSREATVAYILELTPDLFCSQVEM